MKKILILFCGGTISMIKNTETWSLDVAHGVDKILAIEPRITELAAIDVQFVINIDSTNATPRLREEITRIIDEKYDQYDGFLITTGTDTMAFMASALTFSLTNIGKAVIITGAQIAPDHLDTDAKVNLINAVRVATMDIGWVFIVFGTKIVLGCRSYKKKLFDRDAFFTHNVDDAGTIDTEIRLDMTCYPSHHDPLVVKNCFDDSIISIVSSPGMHADHLIRLIDDGVKWFVIWGHGTWSLSDYLFPWLRHAQASQIPVIVTTACQDGTVMGIYSVWLEALKLGVIEAYDMSIEAMMTKLMRCLGQDIPYTEMKKIIQTDLHGEIDTTKANRARNQNLQTVINSL